MKSYVDTAFTIIGGIIRDITARWPDLGTSMEKDMSYLRRDVEHRGLSFLTITLPDLGKAIFQWLDQGVISSSTIPQGVRLKEGRPVFLRSLLSSLFDDQGRLVESPDPHLVQLLIQICFLCKNIELECSPAKVRKTLDEFFHIEDQLPDSHTSTWDSNVPEWRPRFGHPLWGRPVDRTGESPFLPHLGLNNGVSPIYDWDDFRAFALYVTRQFIGDYPVWDLKPRHGPGAVSEPGVSYKYSDMSWTERLENVFPYDWYGSGILSGEEPVYREWPSRLIAVPKSQKGPRLICAEPIAHQWIQQGIWRWLESRINASSLRGCISFRDQDVSRRAALRASHTKSHCTIDLSSASDRISTRLVEYVFQGSNLLDALHASRTRYLSQNLSDRHDSIIRLKKFSTMGSAVTFPIQSILFLIIAAYGVYHHACENGGKLSWLQALLTVTVFGDDIIAPNAAYGTIKLLLEECGLKVNDSKSFHGDNFRESCGMYAFRGDDVSPAYYLGPYDGSPSSLATVIESSNNFHLKGWWYAANAVAAMVPPQELKKLIVADHEGRGGFGLRSFSGISTSHLKKRWDADYQAPYRVALTLSARKERVRTQGQACLTQYFTEAPKPYLGNGDFSSIIDDWTVGYDRRIKLRKGLVRCYTYV